MNGLKSSQLDNYTDTLMYATAIHPGSGNALRDALYNKRYEYQTDDMAQSLNDYAHDVVSKESLRYECSYARYWHGYLIVLKPLLFFLNVSEIRLFFLLTQTFLVTWLLFLIMQKYGIIYTIPVLMAVLLLNPVVMPLSLQFSWVYYIALAGSIILLTVKRDPESEWYLYFFMALGMLTSYFDLLTYPLITLGFPLVLYLLENRKSLRIKRILRTAAVCMAWLAGYVAMWCSKWVLTYVCCDKGIFRNVLAERNSMKTTWSPAATTPWTSVCRALSVVSNKVYLMWFILSLGIFAAALVRRRQKTGGRLIGIVIRALPDYGLYIIVALLPLIWLGVMANHTYVHYWFSYRALSVTVLSAGMMAADIWTACGGAPPQGRSNKCDSHIDKQEKLVIK